MKLGIIIPLKSKKISKDWQVTSLSLANTLNSLINQTLNSYTAIVIGHDIPEGFEKRYPSITFLTVDIPVPDRNLTTFSHKDLILDKNLKIIRGMQALRNEGIDYWYGLDADDLLSNDFVDSVQQINNSAGAIIDGGYLIYKSQNRFIPCKDIYVYCGSTSIIADRYMNIPETLDEKNMDGIPWCRYPHMNIGKFFSDEIQQPCIRIKQPVLGYVLGHGDNISDKWRDNFWKNIKAYIKPYIKGKKISLRIKSTFSLR